MPAGYKNTFFPRNNITHTKHQVAQGGCRISILEGFLEPTGQSPEQRDSNATLTLPSAGSLSRDLFQPDSYDAKYLPRLEKQTQKLMRFELNFHAIRTWGFAVLVQFDTP